MENFPFQNFIDAAPKLYIIPKGKYEVPDMEFRYVDSIEVILDSLDCKKETNKLKLKLFELHENKRFEYVKLFLPDLIDSYLTIRRGIREIKNENSQRKLMLEVYGTIVIITALLNEMNVNIPDGFIADYEKRDQTGIVIGVLKMFSSQDKKPQSVLNVTKIFNNEAIIALCEGLKQLAIIPNTTKEDHFLYAFNGGTKLSDYNKLKVINKKNSLFVYLISELFTNGTTEWRVAYEFNINNPSQIKTNYYGNKTNKPKGYKDIDDLLLKVNLK